MVCFLCIKFVGTKRLPNSSVLWHKNHEKESNKKPLEDGAVSYIRRQAQVAPIKDYYNPRGGKMEQGDYERAKVYAERAKQKYLDKKNSNEVPNA